MRQRSSSTADEVKDDGYVVPDLLEGNATFLRRCFTVGVRGFTSKDPRIQDKLDQWEAVFPVLEAPRFVKNVVSFAARNYRTNLMCHVSRYDHFVGRLQRYVRSRLHGPVKPPRQQATSEADTTEPVDGDSDSDDMDDDDELQELTPEAEEARLLKGDRTTKVVRSIMGGKLLAS
jgi:hypothetical protein